MHMYRSHVLVCAGAGCVSSGCKAVQNALLEEVKARGLDKEITVVETGCMGPCDLGPVMVVYPEGVLYQKVKPADVLAIVEEHLLKGRVVERLTYRLPGSEETIPLVSEMDFFTKQTRIALRNCGIINPENIEEYVARDGYAALGKVLTEMTPEQVVEEVKKSGLRGRGGAGFLTGLKWSFTAKAQGSPKYVVVNADEGDPGAFMDRSVMEGDPHSVLEAMAIAGYAVGANQGYIYIRAEYPLAVQRLKHAIKQAYEYGLIGKNIFGTGFDFDIDYRVGAGAFVCGEETALLASIEGKRGEPRPRPPFPAVSGLWGKPTLLSNVETYANIAPIILKGSDWFASIGTEKSKGTKVFALAGKIRNTGLVEVPMGTSLGEIVYDLGGGIPDGKTFKAVQTGGPSGGCIPAEYLNTAVDYESLQALGSIVGSGGMIVMDEDTCMVDLAKYFLEFVQDESCGKCAPCRIGTKRMLEILDRITKGQGREGDIELLEELAEQIKSTALCGLGQSAPNPVLSTIKYFRHEYEVHIRDKKCPASVCATLFESPCQNTCPVEVDVPIYIDQVKQRKYVEAYMTVKRQNPFPSVCGRVCHHPCEAKCRRAQLDEPIAIRALKRFAADWAFEHTGELPIPLRQGRKEAKVAVVGSGPAGLTCAYYLALRGYPVTVFEALPVAGGMMTVGIPEYRLPKAMLNAEIESIKKAGVEIITNTRIGKDITLEQLKAQGYQAIFLGIGAHNSQKLNISGEELAGVVHGTDFLREAALGKEVAVKGKKVVVVGGGNVAMDAARTALRLGAAEVTVVYRRRRDEMPALPEEIEEAEHEGIKFIFLANPVKALGNGRLTEVECVRMKLGEFDRSGRRRPVTIEGSEFRIACDLLIPAVSQKPDADRLESVGLTKWGTIDADDRTTKTAAEGIFAGGDCVTGPDTLIAAIAAGKKAAGAIDAYLGGDGQVVADLAVERKISGELIEEEMPRRKMPCLVVAKRRGFAEVELGFSEEDAVCEASRCLRCDVKI
ncbi:MAG: NADH-quinone oxidoreductase subunit NuoF [Bacillota bacterium]